MLPSRRPVNIPFLEILVLRAWNVCSHLPSSGVIGCRPEEAFLSARAERQSPGSHQ
jgi:hypothetical protein